MAEKNLQTEWARLLMTSLADAGVRDVVISPGSRSTPLVIASVREPRFTRHSVIDERAAAFLALGQARITGRPSVLICTSGTAAAHYFPAILEANLVGIPLILLTADRPLELADCRASQTIDQTKLFGEHARAFFELVPDASELSLRATRRMATQAVLGSTWPRPGVVHLNARLRKPLEPVAASSDDERALASIAARVLATPVSYARPPHARPAPEDVAHVASLVRDARRGVIMCGPAAASQAAAREAVFALARTTRFPIMAESTSQLRHAPRPADVAMLDAFDLVFRSPRTRELAAMDCVIQIGAPPTSAPSETSAAITPRIVLAEHGWNDPHSNARALLHGPVAASVHALESELRERPPHVDPSFLEFFARANAAAWEAALATLASHPAFTEASAVRTLLDALPEDSVLMLGNSLAVRLVDVYGQASHKALTVLSQRGASGIDGLVAGAVGAAASSAKPTTLLLGDVSLLHDLTSLGLARNLATPLVVVVLNNGGGRIFEQLPLVDTPGIEPSIVEHTTTPHETDFAHAAALFGLPFARIEAVRELPAALAAAYARPGGTLVEVRIEPSGAARLAREVTRAVEAAVLGPAPDRRPA